MPWDGPFSRLRMTGPISPLLADQE
jgi:hypothetical protein